MSQRVLGASAFLTGFRRVHNARAKLSQLNEQGVAIPLVTVLDAFGIDDTEVRTYLKELDAKGIEVVVCRTAKDRDRAQGSEQSSRVASPAARGSQVRVHG